jgi:WD40 repeat protein
VSIAAPPRGHDALGRVGHDPIEALIEEARQRARRRRRLYSVAASIVAFAVVAALVAFNGAGSSTAQRAAPDSEAESPVGDLGVFEPIRGWIVFGDVGAGRIEAVDPNNPSSRHTVLANPEGISDYVRPLGWSPDGTELALEDQGQSGTWIMDSTGSLTNVAPQNGCCSAVSDSPFTPDRLKGSGTALWRLSDGSAYLIPYLVAKWMTVESDTTRKWEISFIVGHTALSPDGEQLLLTAPEGLPRPTERNWGFADLAYTPGLYVLAADAESGRLDGSSLRPIAAGSYLAAVWSPDGTQIAAMSGHEFSPEGREIVMMNADGTDEQTLIAPDPDLNGIAWHPVAPND